MKYCSQCGKQLEDNANFCPSCGAKQHIDSKLDESYYDNGYQQESTSYYEPVNEKNENAGSNDLFGDLSSDNANNVENNEEKSQKSEDKQNKKYRDTAVVALILAFFIPVVGFIIGIKGVHDIKDNKSTYYKMCLGAILVSIFSFGSYVLGIIF